MHRPPTAHHSLDPEALRGRLPEGPGVYLFKDESGEILYVGKAKNLKKRVLSYFRPPSELPYKTGLMMSRARGLDTILTGTETEAFILESTLVKKHLPRYNVVLRDDKAYPCLRLDVKDPYPRLTIVRRIKKDGAKYFGPFSSAQDVRKTLKLINRIFQLRKCRSREIPKRSRPCLNEQLNRCLGVCVREVSRETYGEVVEQVRLFLEGRNHELMKQLEKKMSQAASELRFEEAARIRDQIKAVQHVIQGQHVVSSKLEDQDVIGLEERDGAFQLVIFFVRKGYLSGTRDYLIRDREASRSEVMEAFLKQYYPAEQFIPGRILISEEIADLPSLRDWISHLAGRRVLIERPMRGEKVRLIEMARRNAANLLENLKGSEQGEIMERVAELLRLERPPRSVEGLDISNIQGEMAVGAVVSFVDGLPNRSGYRNYKIKTVVGVDDYGMMSELVSRRLKKGGLPDLLLVDGGRGHLRAVERAVRNSGLAETPSLAAIAKGEGDQPDRIYVPGRKNPLSIRPDDPVLHLFMRIRDEAHRRAISYHRKLRAGRSMESSLDAVPGVGPKRKRALLAHFGDMESLGKASVRELAEVEGISTTLAAEIIRVLKGPSGKEDGPSGHIEHHRG
ncbi:MAG: excinuclease ABC subunit UvrC [Deltaproteobacteria bacterium]|nr:excinuclease ABC subunit UvrC [Deltaproteobacteria bacterium]